MKLHSIIALSLLFAIPATAQVVPSTYENTPGTTSFTGPHATGARTYQMLMHEDLLGDLVGKSITGISFRTPPNASSAWPATNISYANYDVYLSESVTPSARSLTFANNVVGSQTQVRSGPLAVAAGDYSFGGSPNDFGTPIDLTGWIYTGGHLLVEIRHDGNTVSSRSVDAIGTSIAGYGTLFSAAWQSNYSATTGLQGNFSIVKFTTTQVPAPGAFVAFAALLGCAGRRRRR